MTTQGFIIHLDRAVARKPAVEAMVRDAPCPMEIFSAVDGGAMSHDELRRNVVDGTAHTPKYPFPLSKGEIACFLSHRAIWARMLQDDIDVALVLEDDAVIDPPVFKTAFEYAQDSIATCGVIQFQTRAIPAAAPIHHAHPSARIVQPRPAMLRTTAMLLSRAAARRLHEASATIDRPVDAFFQMTWATQQPVFAVYPSGVSEMSEALGGTTIQTAKKSLLERIRREVLRTRYRAAIARAAGRER